MHKFKENCKTSVAGGGIKAFTAELNFAVKMLNIGMSIQNFVFRVHHNINLPIKPMVKWSTTFRQYYFEQYCHFLIRAQKCQIGKLGITTPDFSFPEVIPPVATERTWEQF